MTELAPKKPSEVRLTPEQKLDREITSRGWGALGLLVFAHQALDFSEVTAALLPSAILLTVNIARLVKGFRIHFFSTALGLISLVHAAARFVDEERFPFWYLVPGRRPPLLWPRTQSSLY